MTDLKVISLPTSEERATPDNGWAAAELHEMAARWRRWGGCGDSLWGRYNPGSRTWWPAVRRIWRRMRSHAASRPAI